MSVIENPTHILRFVFSFHSFSKEISCSKGLILLGDYKESFNIKFEDNNEMIVDEILFKTERVMVYDELFKENLITIQGDKTIGNEIYSFTYENTRNIITYAMINTEDNQKNFIVLYEC